MKKASDKQKLDSLKSDITALLVKGKYEEVYSFSEDGTVVKIHLAKVKNTHRYRYIYLIENYSVLKCIVFLQGDIDIGQVRKITSGLKK